MILAGDVGARNTRLGLFRRDGDSLVPVSVRIFKSHQYSGLESVLEDFLAHPNGISAAFFFAAGPVFYGKAMITNLNWDVDRNLLRERFKTFEVSLINDVEATGFGIASLRREDLLSLNDGQVLDAAPAALIAAGTGLGEAILMPGKKKRIPFPTESGHADFAPTTELQCDFLQHVWRRFHHLSWDRVLSGPGLLMIYEFLRDTNHGSERKDVV